MKLLLVLLVVMALVFTIQAQGVDKAVCALPRDVGPCRSSKSNYFFNSETKACEQFLYGGCMGNDNRFGTKDECEAACL